MKKVLVVGAGITGATIARLLYEKGFDVTVIEQSTKIGGACSDEIEMFAYKQNHGSHIFHTNNIVVMQFIRNFTELRPYMHKVKGLINGELVPIPINLNSLEKLFDKTTIGLMLEKLSYGVGYSFENLRSFSEQSNILADWIYTNVFEFYSQKQWGKIPDISTLNRVKAFRYSKDNRYFLDQWQGIPYHGFTRMIESILKKDSAIKLELGVTADSSMFKDYDVVFYTGTIDKLFDFKLGKLPYRTCRFDYEYLQIYKPQDAAVINYTQDYVYTRSHDYSWYIPCEDSIIAYEYPKQHESEDEPRYYPIKEEQNLKLYEEYKQLLAKTFPNVIPAGRLGTYQYLDMDKAIANAMELVKSYLENSSS